MASSVWKGHLTFGLVSVPVKLVKAARAEKVSFRQLHKATGARVQQKLFAQATPVEPETDNDEEPYVSEREAPLAQAPLAKDDSIDVREHEVSEGEPRADHQRLSLPLAPRTWPAREISRDEIIKGFEYEKDRYATLTQEELKALQPKTSRNMEIVEFVKLSDVDPIHFETSYYVIPEAAGERPYSLLYESLRQSNLVGVAQMAMHNREHVVIIRAGRRGIILHTMYYENEIRRSDEFRTDTANVPQKELDLALMLVRALEAPFQPEKYRDTYREKLEELIQSKISGNEVVDAGAAPAMTPVVDILEALKRSLEKTATRKPPVTEQTEPSPAAAPKRGKRKQA